MLLSMLRSGKGLEPLQHDISTSGGGGRSAYAILPLQSYLKSYSAGDLYASCNLQQQKLI